MNWDMIKYFPEDPPCQEHFNTVVATYITAIYDHLEETFGDRLPGATPVRRIRSSQPTQRSKVGPTPDSLEEFCKELIDQEIAQHLLRVTQKIHKRVHGHNAWGWRIKSRFLLWHPGRLPAHFTPPLFRFSSTALMQMLLLFFIFRTESPMLKTGK
jgi:hypothetical protein